MFEVHCEHLWNYIYYKTADQNRSTELLLETFKTIWADRKRFGGQHSLSAPYLIASKLIRKRRGKTETKFDFRLTIHEEHTNPNSPHLNNEFARAANGILESIPPFSRTVLLMNRLDGLTADEISQRLSISSRDILETLDKAARQVEGLLTNSTSTSPTTAQFLDLLGHLTPTTQKGSIEDDWRALMKSIRKEERFALITKGVMRWGGLVLALIVILSIASEWRFAKVTHKTPRAKIAYFLLPDSTFVTLNAESAVQYRRFGWKKSKVVNLTGEAYFDLLPEVNSLTVKTGEVTTTPGYGAVNIFYRNNTVNIHCLGGDTQVDIFEKGKFKLRPNEGLEYTHDLHSHRIEPIIPSEVKAWTRGEFYYTNEPLANVLDEIERQYDVEIKRNDINQDMHYFSGFFTSNNMDIALERVCSQNLLEYSIDWKTRTITIK
jgi:ferric-dicitrate binding protein FerR (iron transport regulator)/DNA-directed RNA polymerase specialized sigma24 family protein